MSDIIDEINACDIVCIGEDEGFPMINPSYEKLTKANQVIVNACVAAHGKAFSDSSITQLKTLLTTEQYEAYANIRNEDARQSRKDRYLDEALPFMHKLIQAEFPSSDLDTKVKQIETEISLWDETIEPTLSAELASIKK